MKMNKEDFNAGTPFSSWLKEELIGEIHGHLHGMKNRGLVDKYKAHVDDHTEKTIMTARKYDDLPTDLKKIAADIIKTELDEDF